MQRQGDGSVTMREEEWTTILNLINTKMSPTWCFLVVVVVFCFVMFIVCFIRMVYSLSRANIQHVTDPIVSIFLIPKFAIIFIFYPCSLS